MRCDEARRLASLAMDEPLAPDDATALASHLADCPACAAFDAGLHVLRQRLRLQPVTTTPDVTALVTQQLADEPAPPWSGRTWGAMARHAAVFLLAVLTGAAATGISGPPEVRAQPLGEQLLEAQSAITSFAAAVTVTEHGWHPQVPLRTYTGSLVYRVPESMVLRLRDTTAYPSSRWHRNSVEVGVADAHAWTSGVRACPRTLQPDCTAGRRVSVTRERAPFDAATPVPGDLVLPVSSLGEHSAPRMVGRRTGGDEALLGVAVTAAQLEPLLRGITQVGNWRTVHPSDPATVWLDEASLTVRSVEITAARDSQRRLWAVSEGYDDRPGQPIMAIAFDQVRMNEPVSGAAFEPPHRWDAAYSGGFTEGPARLVPRPHWLPPGLALHRAGRQGNSQVVTWSDGRGWVRISATDRWRGDRPYGDLGEVVREVALRSGSAYLGDASVGLHTARLDVVVTGSVPETVLLRVADSLGLVGLPAPRRWQGIAPSSATAAVAGYPAALGVGDLPGFAPPAARVDGRTLTLAFAGPGSRAFVIVQRPGRSLSPPLDAHVVGVVVRGRQGRYTPSRGELEWVENQRTVMVRSTTLGLPELLGIAARMEALP